MLDEHGLRNDRTDAARSCKSADDDEEMDEKNGQVAHAGMLSKCSDCFRFGQSL